MSTRCKIGKMYEDGTVCAINVRYDGYPSGVGRLLLSRYGDDTTEDLLSIGNVLSIGATPKETAGYADAPGGDPPEAFRPSAYADDVGYERAVREGWWDYGYLLCDGEWLLTQGDGYRRLREELSPRPADDSWIAKKKREK